MKNAVTSRHSKQRDCILKVLKETVSHPTANLIYDSVRKEIPNISLGTVYRNLSKLSSDGVILKIVTGDGSERYDACCKPHYHMVCRECGNVFDVHMEYLNELDAAAERCGCNVDLHCLTFYGLCKTCTDKLTEEKK